MQPLLLWNNTPYAHKLAGIFGKDFVITDNIQYAAVKNSLNNYSSLIVLCELNWESNAAAVTWQALQGIDLVKEARMQGLSLPVVFTSFLSRKQLLKQHRQSEILKFVGHGFVQLPASTHDFVDEVGSLEPLTPLALKDIQLFACHPDGIVNAKIHQIPYLSEKLVISGPGYVKMELTTCIKDVYAAFQEYSEHFLIEFEKRFPEINEANVEDAIKVIIDNANDLIKEYKRKMGEPVANDGEKPWKLILLDDELNRDSKLVTALEENGVSVICTTTANEAIKVLEKDDTLRGKFPVILTDYRLFEEAADGVTVQQKMQGYNFLKEVGDKFYSRAITAIVYSGMARQFLLDNLNSFKIKTEKYSKRDFKPSDSGAINYLVSRIIELGDKNYETMLAFPLGNQGWKNHLHHYYLQYRSLPDYETRERDICDFCKNWLEQFRNNLNPATPMIKGDSFQARLKDSEEQTMERFIAYFKTRRLAQYLYLYFEFTKSQNSRNEVAAVLMPGYKPGIKQTSINGFFSQVLGLSVTEFPFGATIEELNWFEYDLGITVLDDYRRYRQRFNDYENEIGDFIAGLSFLMALIRNNNFLLKGPQGIELKFNPETFNPYLFDKMDIGFCIDWLGQQKDKMNEAASKELIQLIQKLRQAWI